MQAREDEQHPAPLGSALEAAQRERRIEQLIRWLPQRLRSAIHWLRKPCSRWARLPAGAFLILGGLMWFLPILGLWMLPLGLMLLSEDIAPLRRATDRMLDWVERRHPRWLGEPGP